MSLFHFLPFLPTHHGCARPTTQQTYLSRVCAELHETAIVHHASRVTRFSPSVSDLHKRHRGLSTFLGVQITVAHDLRALLPMFIRLLRERVAVYQGYDAHINRVLQQIEAAEAEVNELRRAIQDLRRHYTEQSESNTELKRQRATLKAEVALLRRRAAKLLDVANAKRRLAKQLNARAQVEIDPIMPQVRAAASAVKKLDKLAIAEVKSFHNPPPLVLLVAEALCVMFDEPPTWADARLMFADSHFLARVLEVCCPPPPCCFFLFCEVWAVHCCVSAYRHIKFSHVPPVLVADTWLVCGCVPLCLNMGSLLWCGGWMDEWIDAHMGDRVRVHSMTTMPCPTQC